MYVGRSELPMIFETTFQSMDSKVTVMSKEMTPQYLKWSWISIIVVFTWHKASTCYDHLENNIVLLPVICYSPIWFLFLLSVLVVYRTLDKVFLACMLLDILFLCFSQEITSQGDGNWPCSMHLLYIDSINFGNVLLRFFGDSCINLSVPRGFLVVLFIYVIFQFSQSNP